MTAVTAVCPQCEGHFDTDESRVQCPDCGTLFDASRAENCDLGGDAE